MTILLPGTGGASDKASVQLATKKGNWIRNARRQERPPVALRAAEKKWRTRFPGLSTRSLSATYNCYGMVFANRRTMILFEEDVQVILDDDGYRKLPDRSAAIVGDVIVYRKAPKRVIEHAGLIIDIRKIHKDSGTEIIVLSQWGGEGEYLHREDHVPEEIFGQHREYYSERIIL